MGGPSTHSSVTLRLPHSPLLPSHQVRAGSAEDDDLAVTLYVRDSLELFQSQPLGGRVFNSASGGFTYTYTPLLAGPARLLVAVGDVPVGTSPFPGTPLTLTLRLSTEPPRPPPRDCWWP
jgi:hypothetical protein